MLNIILFIGLSIFILFIASCCKISSDCSRWEEENFGERQ